MKRMIVLIITIFVGVAAKGHVTSSMMLMYSPLEDTPDADASLHSFYTIQSPLYKSVHT